MLTLHKECSASFASKQFVEVCPDCRWKLSNVGKDLIDDPAELRSRNEDEWISHEPREANVHGKKYFSATHDFWSEEKQCTYLKGMIYTIRPGNTYLASLVENWLSQEKVVLLDNDPREFRIRGTGTVT